MSLPSSKVLYKTMAGCLTPSALASASSSVAPNRKSSLNSSATSVNVALLVLSSLPKYPTRTTLSAVLNSSSAESDVRSDTAGMDCLVMYETIACAFLGPAYGATLSAPLNTLSVGYPSTPYSWQRSCSAVQSTFANAISLSLSVVAASSYSGASALQCPHHGAKTVLSH